MAPLKVVPSLETAPNTSESLRGCPSSGAATAAPNCEGGGVEDEAAKPESQRGVRQRRISEHRMGHQAKRRSKAAQHQRKSTGVRP